MRRYSLLDPLWMSFFSQDLYRDVGQHWGNVAFLYLFFLLAVAWLPRMIRFDAEARDYVRDQAPAIVDQIPRITIRDGRASAEGPQPHCIVEPGKRDCIAIIDTTGSTKAIEGAETRILLTETHVIYAPSASETRTYSLAKIEELTIEPASLKRWLQTGARFLPVVAFPFVVLVSFCFRMTQALMYAVVGLAFSRLQGMRLSFATLCRLAIVALTPVIVLQMVIDLSGAEAPFPRVAFLAIALGYLFFGIKACMEPKGEEPQVPGPVGGSPPF
jgi:hypothetical protein